MKNKLYLTLLVGIASAMIISCEDFIEVNLGKKAIIVLAPANNTVSSIYAQLFKWEDLKGAEEYQLQIVKPDFSNIQQFILDSTIHTTQFSYALQPGTYQWRVRAKNNSSATDYVTYNISVDTALNLSTQKVGLLLPLDNSYSKTLTNTFSWNSLLNADSYVFQIVGGQLINTQQNLSTTYTFASEGTYKWQVTAQNNFGNSSFNTYTINIVTTPPAIPTPQFPVLDTVKANPVPLKWTCSGTGLNEVASTHLIITDSTSNSIFVDTTIANIASPLVYNFYSATLNTYYYWKVSAIDKAGNESAFFTRRRFKRVQ